MEIFFGYPSSNSLEEDLHIIDDGVRDFAYNLNKELVEFEYANM